MSIKKIKIDSEKVKFLKKAAERAFNNFDYNKAIEIFQEYNKKYELDEGSLYQMGMLYDHIAQGFRNGFRSKKNISEANKYFDKAIKVFKLILKQNSKSYDALYGIGKVFRNKEDYKKALFYSKRAHILSAAMGAKAVYGIGFIYELIKDYKRAEHWYRKDIKDKGKDDYSANLNLLTFLNRRHRIENRDIAEIVKKHYKKQPLGYRNSVVGQAMRYEIDMVLNPNKPKFNNKKAQPDKVS